MSTLDEIRAPLLALLDAQSFDLQRMKANYQIAREAAAVAGDLQRQLDAQSLELQRVQANYQIAHEAAAQAGDLLRELQAVREALGKYGVHENGCAKFMSLADVECTCGLDAALKPSRGATP